VRMSSTTPRQPSAAAWSMRSAIGVGDLAGSRARRGGRHLLLRGGTAVGGVAGRRQHPEALDTPP
jgi:hypothetical protein